MIALARSLELNVIAEGVETESQRALLIRYGCSEMQVYLVAKPCPAAELAPFIASRNHSSTQSAANPKVRRLRTVYSRESSQSSSGNPDGDHKREPGSRNGQA